MNLLIDEVRAGKWEGSVVSIQTFDTAARLDRDTWDAFRRELEDIGISPGVIAEKQSFIIAWFQKAVLAGRLDEDLLDDDSSGTLTEGRSLENEGIADGGSDSRLQLVAHGEATIASKDKNKIASSDEDQSKPIPSAVKSSKDLLVTQQHTGRTALSEPYVIKSRLKVSYLLSKLRRTPTIELSDAIQKSDVGKVKTLLHQGANPNAIFHRGPKTMVQAAVLRRSTEIVELLLDRGGYVNSPDGSHESAMHSVACRQHEAMMELFLAKGANVNAKDSYGNTALHTALTQNFLSFNSRISKRFLNLLLTNGAQINAYNKRHRTPLILAVEAQATGDANIEWIIGFLLSNGAEIDAVDKVQNTALYYAITFRNKNLVKLLLDRGAIMDIEAVFDERLLFYRLYDGILEIFLRQIAQNRLLNIDKKRTLTAKEKTVVQKVIEAATAPKRPELYRLLQNVTGVVVDQV